MSIKPDNITFHSNLPNYINIGEPTGTLTISGTVANGATANFPISIPTTSKNTFADIYAKNSSNGNKQLISTSNYFSNDAAAIGGVYQHISTELVQMQIAISSSAVTLTVSVFNGSGALITLVTQNIVISVVEYQIPF